MPPTANRASVMLVIQLTLESILDIVYLFHTILDQRLPGFQRAFATAADQQHWNRASLLTTYTTQDNFPDLGGKIGIDLP